MLLSQDGGGHQHQHLLAAQDTKESGAHGDLGLTETHVSADEAVHGHFATHVGQHLTDGPLLVFGFLVRKGFLEFGHHGLVHLECMTRPGLAGGIDPHQLLGHILDVLGRFLFGALPGAVPQPVEHRPRPLQAGIILYLVELVDWDVNLVPTRVLDQQKIAFDATDGQPLQPLVASDAVFDMHHRVAFLELTQ